MAYTLAIYALPFRLGLTAARFAYPIFCIACGGFVGVAALLRLSTPAEYQAMVGLLPSWSGVQCGG